MSAFKELYRVGRRGYPLKRPPTLKSITAEAAERERRNMLARDWTCWECDETPRADAWLMVYRMWGHPHARLVCPSCVERVRRRRSGLRLRWFAPMEAQP